MVGEGLWEEGSEWTRPSETVPMGRGKTLPGGQGTSAEWREDSETSRQTTQSSRYRVRCRGSRRGVELVSR